MSTSRLPVLALPHPLILLPSARVTIPVSKSIGEYLLSLIEESDALPIVAAVPMTVPVPSLAGEVDRENDLLLPPPSPPSQDDATQKSLKDPEASDEKLLSEWGTAARVLRLIRPPATTRANAKQPYLVSLHGLTRVKLINRLKPKNKLGLSTLAYSIPNRDVEYPPAEKTPSKETVERFKQSAGRLLERLSRDSVQKSRREGYSKVLGMLEDIQDARTPWMADVLISTIGCDYTDKLSESNATISSFLLANNLTRNLIIAILSSADSEARLQNATDIFLKQASISEVSRKIASAVDESLSKQQKEFFLRQQLQAIQRELQALQRSSNNNNNNSGSNPGTTSPAPSPEQPKANTKSDPAVDGGSASELDDDEQHEADDMAELKKRIEAMAPGSEERKMGVREWRRLKRIPQASVENGVIRTYASISRFDLVTSSDRVILSLNGSHRFPGPTPCLFNHPTPALPPARPY